MAKATFKDYYKLTKPGIVYGNLITTIAAFLFAWQWRGFTEPGIALFFSAAVGISLVIASACVFNNYLDRDIDKKMVRTQDRPLVTGVISVQSALTFGTVLGLLGWFLLFDFVNALTAVVAFIGFVFYVVVYGAAKRDSHWGAVVGSISGAVPIVVGYIAVTSHLDTAALILFLILVAWQMPHFYAIAIYRFDEYVAAEIPTLPAQKGIKASKVHIFWYIIAYSIAVSLLTIFGYAGYTYLIIVLLAGLYWLYLAFKGFKHSDKTSDQKWARQIFFFSLINLLVFCFMLALAPLLP